MTDTTNNETTTAQIEPEVAKAETQTEETQKPAQESSWRASGTVGDMTAKEFLSKLTEDAVEGIKQKEEPNGKTAAELAQGAKLLVGIIKHYHGMLQDASAKTDHPIPTMMSVGFLIESTTCDVVNALADKVLAEA